VSTPPDPAQAFLEDLKVFVGAGPKEGMDSAHSTQAAPQHVSRGSKLASPLRWNYRR
jgi:hypothetical protein